MKFTIAASAIAALLAVVQAAPTTAPLHARDSIGYCDTSSFENETSGASPSADDCRQIAANIADDGDWTVGGYGVQHQLVQYESCAFGVESSDWTVYKVGNQDIIDLINDSISQYESDGKIGSKGTMKCKHAVGGDGNTPSVTWGLYHN